MDSAFKEGAAGVQQLWRETLPASSAILRAIGGQAGHNL